MRDGRFRRLPSASPAAAGPCPRGSPRCWTATPGSRSSRWSRAARRPGQGANEDLIIDVDGVAVADAGDLQRLMQGERIGRLLTVRALFRGGELLELTVVPVELAH